jgi:serine/threonine-protein kinase
MNCPRCGAPNREGARFCGCCGHAITGLLAPGTMLLQRYRVLRILGQGGFGAVYHAEDARIPGKTWAVKELRDVKPEEQADAQRLFESEAKLLANLSHPGLPAVVDYFFAGSKRYLVMEFVEGDTLLDMLRHHAGPLPESLVIDWARQLCDVLDYLHSQPQPVIHRDIKPENIKHTPNGTIKLLDFGLARTFKGGRAHDTVKSVGTLGYVSPEQAFGIGESDARSDIYSLGATLFCLLGCHHPADNAIPFQFPSLRSLNSLVSARTEAIIAQAVQVDPGHRWQSVRAMRSAIEQLPGVAVETPLAMMPPAVSPSPGVGGVTVDAQAAADHNRQGIDHARAGQYDQALIEYQYAVQLDPQNAIYHYNLAGVYHRQGRLQDALPEAQAAVSLDSSDADFWNRLGQICYDLDLYDQASDATRRALQIKPQDGVLYYNLGAILEEMGRTDEALPAFEQALRLRPDDASIHNRLGNIHFSLDRFAQALPCYQRAIQIQPGDAVYHCNLANTYCRLKRFHEAQARYRQSIQLDATYARPHNELGDLYYEQQDYRAALQSYQQAVALAPDRALYVSNLAYAHSALQQDVEAKKALQRAIRLAPDQASLHNRLGLILFREGDYAGALQMQQQAINLAPDVAVYAFNVGLDLELLGQDGQAIAMYRRALQLDPGLADAQDRLRSLSKH